VDRPRQTVGSITHVAFVNHYSPCLAFATNYSLVIPSFLYSPFLSFLAALLNGLAEQLTKGSVPDAPKSKGGKDDDSLDLS
jgi:hypothetical protein